MSAMLEFTVAIDTTDPRLNSDQPIKAMIAIDSIQSIFASSPPSTLCQVVLVPSFPAYGENAEGGESVAQDQRTLYVTEDYNAIRSALNTHRGVISLDASQPEPLHP